MAVKKSYLPYLKRINRCGIDTRLWNPFRESSFIKQNKIIKQKQKRKNRNTMLRKFRMTLWTLVVFIASTLAGAHSAVGQTTAYTAVNAYNKVAFAYNLTAPDTTAVRTWAVVDLAIEPTFGSMVMTRTDTIPATSAVHRDTSGFLSAGIYYGRVKIYWKDTLGGIHSAPALAWIYINVTITPNKPTISSFGTVVNDMHYPQVPITFSTNYDSVTIIGTISYYDSLLLSPATFYPFPGVKFGGQNLTVNVTMPYLYTNMLYSAKIKIANSFGDTTTSVFWGRTLPAAGPATVGSIYGETHTFDSVHIFVPVSTTGVLTTCTVNWATSPTGPAIGSYTTTLAGTGGVTPVGFGQGGLSPSTGYYFWVCVANVHNTSPNCTSRMLIPTLALPGVFMPTYTTMTVIDSNTQRFDGSVTVPVGQLGNVYALVNVNTDSAFDGPTYYVTPITIGLNIPSGTSSFHFNVTGLHAYDRVFTTLFGTNNTGTVIYNPGTIRRDVTFMPPLPTCSITAATPIPHGSGDIVSYVSSGATSVMINGHPGSLGSNSFVLSGLINDTTFTMIATNATGSSTSVFTIHVLPNPHPRITSVTCDSCSGGTIGVIVNIAYITDSATSVTVNGVSRPTSWTYTTLPCMHDDSVVIKAVNGIYDTTVVVHIDIIEPVIDPLHVDDFILLNSFKVYPNPANATLIISTSYPADIEYKIVNVLGQTVTATPAVKGETVIDVSSMPSGMYELNIIKNSTRFKTTKFIKQ
jgi:hypothetical protein